MLKRIAITGGIASGKSLLGSWLTAPPNNYAVIDADHTVHDLLAHNAEVIEAIAERFGNTILLQAPHTGVDRTQLGARVFEDSTEATEHRRWLEQLLHPKVAQVREAFFAEQQAHGARFVFALIPLLFETMEDASIAQQFDETWLVAIPPALQLERLQHHRGMTLEAAQARINAQYPLERKQQRATHTLWNTHTPEALFQQALALM
ncbi:MAG: dephospho-CoA kinase [Vampirovibrionales bacterium]